jgi:hypothetical protein
MRGRRIAEDRIADGIVKAEDAFTLFAINWRVLFAEGDPLWSQEARVA